MATQGLVSVTRNGKVVAKAVAGCDGYNANKLAQAIQANGYFDAEIIAGVAKDVGFGCDDCLVVMDSQGSIIAGDEPGPLYRQQFSDPLFNPRWECGICAHTEVVELEPTPTDTALDGAERGR
jgi:hypothetical protein